MRKHLGEKDCKKAREVVKMCGIVGVITKDKASLRDLINRLKKLEYRGYDSFGFATNMGEIEKHVGEIFVDKIKDVPFSVAVSHTRWATHGGVTETNAHPHVDCLGNIFIVHNGIIENYLEFKKELESKGHEFRTETDSEIIAHFFEDRLKNKSFEESAKEFLDKAEGTFAILLLRRGENRIYALKRDSPLVLGLCNDGFVVGSDIYAFSDMTNKAIFFEDNEFAVIDFDDYKFFNRLGSVTKEPRVFEWSKEEVTKKEFEHFMIKEIHEQPIVVKRLLDSLETTQKDKMKKFEEMVKNAKKVVFIAAGTSYHASLLGVYFLNKVGVEAQALIASEAKNFLVFGEDTLVIAVSQSGETMDVITVLKEAKKKGVKLVSVVNVPYSSIQRMSDLSLEILAGQEICVASTKTFTNQVALLLRLASSFGFKVDLKDIPDLLRRVLGQEERIKQLAKELKNEKDIYVIGRGLSYPVAREVALKLKEISYIHAEGMMGGELKHGTIALIEDGTPVISLISNNDSDMLSNTKEVEARGAKVILVSNNDFDIGSIKFKVPTSNDGKFSILANAFGQLLTYYIAKEKALPIDKPRNLAKSVTVR
jgi:glucosamine--fructose-6-phosphate aminotransferase (isomerizing)